LTENPTHGAREQSGGRQDGPHGKMQSELAKDEDRLRQLVAGYNLDPETINVASLNTIKRVTRRIYGILATDEKSPNGVFARIPNVWADLDDGYHKISYAAMSLRPMIKRLEDLNGQPNSSSAELDEAAGRVADRMHKWLSALTEFQQNLSEFYKGLGTIAGTST
jgi:hypothetical protein